jgi:hypothetical protein
MSDARRSWISIGMWGPRYGSEHLKFAALVGKHAGVGSICISLHLFRKETKSLNRSWVLGGQSQLLDVKFAAD